MSLVEDFLTQNEEQEVIDAIRRAEDKTSGEIRVHLEHHDQGNPEGRAMAVFHFLKMDNTKLQNGVLIYVAVSDHSFAIFGDEGIDKAVPSDFWNRTKELIETHFKNKNFKQGLVEGIQRAGEQLEQHFPWLHHDDDELSNEISKE
jgi:uncharacterized membrane protein